jgi:hypothetical protein
LPGALPLHARLADLLLSYSVSPPPAATARKLQILFQCVTSARRNITRLYFVSYDAVSLLAPAPPGATPSASAQLPSWVFSLQERARSIEQRTGSRERGRCVRTLPWCAAPPTGEGLGCAGQATTIRPEDPPIYYMQHFSKLSSRPMQDEIWTSEANKIDANNLLSRWDAYSNPRFSSLRLQVQEDSARITVTLMSMWRDGKSSELLPRIAV